ncbi:hypothetical protein RM51_13085 [Chryseobacterium taiwanense]|uniref:Uncharacterized protein n=1 Tax=Chryseobacterium taiwanense TaxID=363331 RepID=A0A0B4CMG1_9FLAO|nr:hypothetical protein RM51_13085 [Chryseobacterium taiwanense]
MNLLVITPYEIILFAVAVIVLYIVAISTLFKNKSGILPYLVLILFPVLGPLGIVFGNYMKKIK